MHRLLTIGPTALALSSCATLDRSPGVSDTQLVTAKEVVQVLETMSYTPGQILQLPLPSADEVSFSRVVFVSGEQQDVTPPVVLEDAKGLFLQVFPHASACGVKGLFEFIHEEDETHCTIGYDIRGEKISMILKKETGELFYQVNDDIPVRLEDEKQAQEMLRHMMEELQKIHERAKELKDKKEHRRKFDSGGNGIMMMASNP